MAKITSEMREFVKREHCLVATADQDGCPNLAVKGSTMVIDEETLAFGELRSGKTYHNIIKNPLVLMVAANLYKRTGYRFLGEAKLITEGILADRFAEMFATMGNPHPLAVVQVKVKEIFDLRGKRLE
ncbi:MAG: hypothetical protein APF81_25805 [Desulfosporosinus sp. BRH_c37]|nr:MAG: hypothetical protein APF81_25805 [Desulfosporosinus sp. BRH_c37]